MQYQIPGVSKAHVNQGALVQQTSPIPGVAQPEMRGYSALQEGRYRQSANVYIHQGATVQQTSPITTALQPELSRYSVLQNPRYRGGAIYVDSGTTVQIITGGGGAATSPIPQPSQNDRNGYWWLQQQSRFRTDVVPRFETIAPVVPQTYVFGIQGPELSQFSALQRGRYFTTVTPRFEGATVQQTNPIPGVAQPEMSRYSALNYVRQIPGVGPQLTGIAVAQIVPIPPVSAIEFSRYQALLDAARLIPGAVPQTNQGASVQATFPIPQPQRVEFNAYWWRLQQNRFRTDPMPRLENTVIVNQQTYIFPIAGPELSTFTGLQRNRFITLPTPRLEGATVQQTVPVPVPPGPELSRYQALQFGRFIAVPVQRTEGLIAQPTVLIPLTQGQLEALVAAYATLQLTRYQPSIPARTENPIVYGYQDIFPSKSPVAELIAYGLLSRVQHPLTGFPDIFLEPPPFVQASPGRTFICGTPISTRIFIAGTSA